MAAIIRVTNGPDAGKQFALTRSRCSIGRGAVCEFRLSDPQLAGKLDLEYQDGVLTVTNSCRHAVYLGRATLEPRQQLPWYSGENLQPTSATLLVLEVTDAAGLPKLSAGSSGGSKVGQMVVIGVLFAVAGILFALPTPGSSTNSANLSQEFEDQVTGLNTKAAATNLNLRRLRSILQEARMAELRGFDRRAVELYAQVRDLLLTQAVQSAAKDAALEVEPLRKLVEDRLLSLES